MAKQFTTCGVPYTIGNDGRIQVRDGFPLYTQDDIRKKVAKIWSDYGQTITKAASDWDLNPSWLVGVIYIESGGNPRAAAACEPKWCPALWKRGACASQGGTEKYCAGGLMAFISSTAAMFGKTMDYFIDHPHEMIHAAAELIAVGGPNRRTYHGGVKGNNGDVLSVVKMYNGGAKCGGGGITGHGGQADYVSKFVKVCNTFVAMGLMPKPYENLLGPKPGVVLAWAAIGAIGYYYLDKQYKLTSRASSEIGKLI
jgi:hypothetical protein